MIEKAKAFTWPAEYTIGSFGITDMTMKFAVQVIDMKDEMIVETCKEAARKAGVTDLTIIDRDGLVQYFGGVTERQRFCPFCHNIHNDNGGAEVKTYGKPLKIRLEKCTTASDPPFYGMMINHDGTQWEAMLPIKYCPMCGRKLEVKNEEADK